MGDTTFSTQFENEKEKLNQKRLNNREQYQKFKDQALKEGRTVSPKMLAEERRTLTGGNPFDSADLGYTKTDEAISARHNSKVAQIKVAEMTETLAQTSKQKESAFSMVNTEQSSFGDYTKMLEERLGPDGAASLLQSTGINSQAWNEHRSTLRDADLEDEVAGNLWKRINTADDIDKFYDGMPKWKRDGLKEIFQGQGLVAEEQAIKEISTKILSSKLENLDQYTDDDLKAFIKTMGLTNLKRDLTDDEVNRLLPLLKVQRDKALNVQLDANQDKFRTDFYNNPDIKAFIDNTITNTDSFTNENFMNVVNRVAASAGLGNNYFATPVKNAAGEITGYDMLPQAEFEKKVGAILGVGWLTTMKKQNIVATQGAVRAKAEAKAKEVIATVRANAQSQTQSMIAVRVEAQKDQTNGARTWYENSPAALAATQFFTAYFVPPNSTIRAEILTEIETVLENSGENFDINATVGMIYQKFRGKGVTTWATAESKIASKYSPAFYVKNGSKLDLSADAAIDKLSDTSSQIVEDMEKLSKSTYNEGLGFWLDTNYMDNKLEGLKVTYEAIKERIEKTFMVSRNDVMWHAQEGTSWKGANGAKAIGQKLLKDLKEEYDADVDQIRATKPQGEETNTGNGLILPGVGMTENAWREENEAVVAPLRAILFDTNISSGMTVANSNMANSAIYKRSMSLGKSGFIRFDEGAEMFRAAGFATLNADNKYKLTLPAVLVNQQTNQQGIKGQLSSALINNAEFKAFATKLAQRKLDNPNFNNQRAKKYIRNALLLGYEYDKNGSIRSDKDHNISKMIRNYRMAANVDVFNKYDNKPYDAPLGTIFPGEDVFANSVLAWGLSLINQQTQ